MRYFIYLFLIIFTGCGAYNNLTENLQKIVDKVEDLHGYIDINGILNLENLIFDFGQVTVGEDKTKTIAITNYFTNSLTIPLEQSNIQSPISIENNSCYNVKINDTCKITIKLSTENQTEQAINQKITILGLSLSITGQIIFQEDNEDSQEQISYKIHPTVPEIDIGNLIKGYKYILSYDITNNGQAKIKINYDEVDDERIILQDSCKSEISPRGKCRFFVKIDCSLYDLGQKFVDIKIINTNKRIKFNVVNKKIMIE